MSNEGSERLHARLDGELAPEEAERLDREIAGDPGLKEEWDALRAVDRALGSLPGHEAPADFTERVVQAARRHRPRGVLVRLVAPLAAAAALLAAVLLLPRSGDRASNGELFTTEEHLDYVWEVDEEAIGSLSLDDLEAEILEELELT